MRFSTLKPKCCPKHVPVIVWCTLRASMLPKACTCHRLVYFDGPQCCPKHVPVIVWGTLRASKLKTHVPVHVWKRPKNYLKVVQTMCRWVFAVRVVQLLCPLSLQRLKLRERCACQCLGALSPAPSRGQDAQNVGGVAKTTESRQK